MWSERILWWFILCQLNWATEHPDITLGVSVCLWLRWTFKSVACNQPVSLPNVSVSKLQEDSEGQGSLACCSPRGHRESDMTEPLNNSPLWVQSVEGLNRTHRLTLPQVRIPPVCLSSNCDTAFLLPSHSKQSVSSSWISSLMACWHGIPEPHQ